MEDLTPKIYGFHCNNDDDITKFKKRELKLLNSIEDDIWLGDGMYFWDNESNSKYWQRNRERKYPDQKFSVVKVLMSLTHMLDLTDTDHRKFCKKVIADLQEQGVTGFDETQLGKNINVIFSESEILNTFHLVKIHGLYSHWSEDSFLGGRRASNSNHPTSNVKTIYCVKNEDAIHSII